MPTIIPSTTSDKRIGELTPKATRASSQVIRTEWSQKIKDHALFSARTTSERYVEAIRQQLVDIASRKSTPQDAERNLRETLQNLGYRPETGFPDDKTGRVPPASAGSIKDLSANRRIQLIIDTNVKQARSLGQVAASEDPAMLLTSPAWKLTRTGARKKPRGDWKRRWEAAGKKVGWRGASKRQLIALKTSPIWQAIGDGAGGFEDTLGTAYPPFAFGSGMAWVNVGRREWERICKDEGIPDYMGDITAKAKELKAAREAAKSGSVASVSNPSNEPTASAKGQAGGLSPLSAKPSPQRPATTPVADLFSPNLAERQKANAAVDNALNKIGGDLRECEMAAAQISDFIKEIEGIFAENSDLAFQNAGLLFTITGYLNIVKRTIVEIRSLQGRVVNYGSAIGATPVPTKLAQQGGYNSSMQRLASSSSRTAQSAHSAAMAAIMRLKAATRLVAPIKAAVKTDDE